MFMTLRVSFSALTSPNSPVAFPALTIAAVILKGSNSTFFPSFANAGFFDPLFAKI
jgi:hypothetical protein